MSGETNTNPGGAREGAPLGVLAWAGLTGAAGVALAAVAAHKVDSPALATAAIMLMVHATAAVAVLAACSSAGLGRAANWLAAAMLGAVALFSGDVTLHTLTGAHIFPMAAPTGGSTLIGCWLALAIISIWRRVRGG